MNMFEPIFWAISGLTVISIFAAIALPCVIHYLPRIVKALREMFTK